VVAFLSAGGFLLFRSVVSFLLVVVIVFGIGTAAASIATIVFARNSNTRIFTPIPTSNFVQRIVWKEVSPLGVPLCSRFRRLCVSLPTKPAGYA
jgi:hypothetical protein